MARADLPRRGSERKPVITVDTSSAENDDKIVTSAGVGFMAGSVAPKQRTQEEEALPMPTPTNPLSTSAPS